MGMAFKLASLLGFALAFPLCTQAAPAISLATTVGKASVHCTDPGNPDNCGLPPTNMVSVEPGEPYVVGYNVTNTGDTALTSHTLTDTLFGLLLNNFPYTLPPGSSAFITHRGNAPLVSGSYPQSATLDRNHRRRRHRLRVRQRQPDRTSARLRNHSHGRPRDRGLHRPRTTSVPAACRPATPSTSCPGRKVVIGYEMHNSAAFAMPTHTLVDSALGIQLNNFTYNLTPGASAFLTVFDTPASDTVRSATWTVTTTYGATAARSDQYEITRFLFADGFE